MSRIYIHIYTYTMCGRTGRIHVSRAAAELVHQQAPEIRIESRGLLDVSKEWICSIKQTYMHKYWCAFCVWSAQTSHPNGWNRVGLCMYSCANLDIFDSGIYLWSSLVNVQSNIAAGESKQCSGAPRHVDGNAASSCACVQSCKSMHCVLGRSRVKAKCTRTGYLSAYARAVVRSSRFSASTRTSCSAYIASRRCAYSRSACPMRACAYRISQTVSAQDWNYVLFFKNITCSQLNLSDMYQISMNKQCQNPKPSGNCVYVYVSLLTI